MQFQTPQFIEVEDKLFGPFTFKQFIYLAGGAGLSFVVYKIAPLLVAIPIILAVVGLALALTFAKVNGRPFAHALENFFTYLMQSKMYLWKKTPAKEEKPAPTQVGAGAAPAPGVGMGLTGSKLKELSWSLDVLEMKKR